MSKANPQDRPSYTHATQIRVECLRALHPAMTAARAADKLALPVDVVEAVWADQDTAAGIDNAVDMYVPNPSQKRHKYCRSGRHLLAVTGAYVRPNGDRECLPCRAERKALEAAATRKRSAA